jgi:hypothetical protein
MGLIEAWSRWFEADANLRNSGLWGFRIIWWGRIGMVLAFIGGLTGIIDIIGAEKIGVLEEGGRITRAYTAICIVIIGSLAVWAAIAHPYVTDDPLDESTNPWFVLIVGVGVLVAALVAFLYAKLFYWAEKYGGIEKVIRIFCFVLLVIGFQFDLLAS